MARTTTLIRIEKVLDVFHDGFHKLFGSSERRLKPTKKKSAVMARIEREHLERQNNYKAEAKSQDMDIAYTEYMDELKKERLANMSLADHEALRDRLDGLETENEASQDHDIER